MSWSEDVPSIGKSRGLAAQSIRPMQKDFDFGIAIEFAKNEVDRRNEADCFLTDDEAAALGEKLFPLRRGIRASLYTYAAGGLWHLLSLLQIKGITDGGWSQDDSKRLHCEGEDALARFNLKEWATGDAALLPIPSAEFLATKNIASSEDWQRIAAECFERLKSRIVGIKGEYGVLTSAQAIDLAGEVVGTFFDSLQVLYMVVNDEITEEFKDETLLELVSSTAEKIGYVEAWAERVEARSSVGAKGIVKKALDRACLSPKMVTTAGVLLAYPKAPEKTIKARLAIAGQCDVKTASRWLDKFRNGLNDEARARHFEAAKKETDKN